MLELGLAFHRPHAVHLLHSTSRPHHTSSSVAISPWSPASSSTHLVAPTMKSRSALECMVWRMVRQRLMSAGAREEGRWRDNEGDTIGGPFRRGKRER